MDGPSCAGIAHWDAACIATVATFARTVTQGTTTSWMTLPTKCVQSSAPGSRQECKQGAERALQERNSNWNGPHRPDRNQGMLNGKEAGNQIGGDSRWSENQSVAGVAWRLLPGPCLSRECRGLVVSCVNWYARIRVDLIPQVQTWRGSSYVDLVEVLVLRLSVS